MYDLSLSPEIVDKKKISLEEHKCEGLGIDWHPSKEHQLVTGAFDKKAVVWDLNGNLSQNNVLKPVTVYEHSSGVSDTKWFKKDENLIAIATQ